MMDIAVTDTRANLSSEQLLCKTRDALSQAQARISTLTKSREKLSKRVTRFLEKLGKALMTRELVKLGVPMEQVGNAVADSTYRGC
jgi:hypothetical protein